MAFTDHAFAILRGLDRLRSTDKVSIGKYLKLWDGTISAERRNGSGASADNSPSSAADACPVTLVSDGKPLEIGHLCFAASRSSVHQGVFSGPKSADAPEPLQRALPSVSFKGGKREVGRLNSNASVIENNEAFAHLKPLRRNCSSEEDTLAGRPPIFRRCRNPKQVLRLGWVLILIALYAPSHAVNLAELQKPPPEAIVPSHERVTALINELAVRPPLRHTGAHRAAQRGWHDRTLGS